MPHMRSSICRVGVAVAIAALASAVLAQDTPSLKELFRGNPKFGLITGIYAVADRLFFFDSPPPAGSDGGDVYQFDIESGKAKLKMGQQGPAVLELQKKLGVVATGQFDKNTEVAVAQAQTKAGLPPTGVVDDKTLAAIEGKSGGKPASPPPAPTAAEAQVGALATDMAAGKADVKKAKAELDKIPGVVRLEPSYPRELKDQIHLHNLEHLTRKLKAKEPLSAEERMLAQGYLDVHAKDMSAPSATSLTELNQVYGGAYGQFVQAAGAAGMKAKP